MLNPEEEKELRTKIQKELEEKNFKSVKEQKKRKEQYDTMLEREKMIQKIIIEEEEKFYQSRGYVKYTSHTGNIYWLTPEEYETKMSRRKTRRKKKHDSKDGKTTKLVLDWKYLIALISILGIGLVVIFLLINFISKLI
ncbi:MAG TPA: hypothetical protein ENN73_04800 [Firmicutes bacterium]|nr:hypothetical protein [Bacillota bacterium]